ncbi:MAG: PQQ-dependent dehydrogenase, methanol/ethanol family, partial [Devosia sp.]
MSVGTHRSALALPVVLGFSLLAQGASAATDLKTLAADPNQWVMPAKNYAATRFSELNQINAGNVGQLQHAWSFSNGVTRGQEAAPLVIDNTMYVVSPYPNKLFALDATTGDLKWTYAPPPILAAEGVACCDVVNRGAAYDNGKVF